MTSFATRADYEAAAAKNSEGKVPGDRDYDPSKDIDGGMFGNFDRSRFPPPSSGMFDNILREPREPIQIAHQIPTSPLWVMLRDF